MTYPLVIVHDMINVPLMADAPSWANDYEQSESDSNLWQSLSAPRQIGGHSLGPPDLDSPGKLESLRKRATWTSSLAREVFHQQCGGDGRRSATGHELLHSASDHELLHSATGRDQQSATSHRLLHLVTGHHRPGPGFWTPRCVPHSRCCIRQQATSCNIQPQDPTALYHEC